MKASQLTADRWPRLTVAMATVTLVALTSLPRPSQAEGPSSYRQRSYRSRHLSADQAAGPLVRQPAASPIYRALILDIARRFRVPAGVLYGIWWKEGRWLKQLWGNTANWPPASSLISPSSTCVRRYGWSKCRYHWNALRAICSQRRQGRPICDPFRVRVSYAGAMGPLQHMPGVLLRCSSTGSCRWSQHAVDYDGDGTVDPHYLPDALASAARYLRIRYDRHCHRRSWRCAVNLYFGSSNSGYFSGSRWKVGVVQKWRQWCSFPGNCR